MRGGARIFHGQGRVVWVVLRRMSKRVYVVAGELSGDAHGAGLLRSLKEMVPGVEIHGVGGPAMREVAGAGLQGLGGGCGGDGDLGGFEALRVVQGAVRGNDGGAGRNSGRTCCC